MPATPNSSWKIPLFGVALAIAITTTMDATGLSAFSALPLLPLMMIFWFWQRMSRREIGFVWGRPPHYLLAAVYPLIVIGVIAAIALLAGATDISHTNWRKVAINLPRVTLATFLVALVTEEGFFRGWLWASLKRSGLSDIKVLAYTSVAFSLWHFSAVMLPTGFNPPRAQVPVFMVNAALLGAIWGMMRWLSGSIVVSSLSHGLWNGIDYVFFGFGTHKAALGVQQTAIYGPENGWLGLAANLAFAVALMTMIKRRKSVAN